MPSYTRKLIIKGAQRDVIATPIPQFGKSFITLTLSVAFNGFSYAKSYNLRDGALPDGLDIGTDFIASANKEYDDQVAVVQLLIARGFVLVPDQN